MDGDKVSDLLCEVEDSLDDLGYTAVTDLGRAVEAGLESDQFTGLVTYLAQEVGQVAGLEDRLLETDVRSEAWIMELSSLLRELGCPHSSLTQVSSTPSAGSENDKQMGTEVFISFMSDCLCSGHCQGEVSY